ncbi:hypothetical protein HYC85_029832 [Camellia sinensis]|uniref:Uncharacterized protein n=1 Tax=Camellia sinensis TaxID=4442 RepID=A0A7J7G0C2_CAMSI|nr:hypothetical protein HYC85_029832 [Camellia sinensis]
MNNMTGLMIILMITVIAYAMVFGTGLLGSFYFGKKVDDPTFSIVSRSKAASFLVPPFSPDKPIGGSVVDSIKATPLPLKPVSPFLGFELGSKSEPDPEPSSHSWV